jgi:hypothetical protein
MTISGKLEYKESKTELLRFPPLRQRKNRLKDYDKKFAFPKKTVLGISKLPKLTK